MDRLMYRIIADELIKQATFMGKIDSGLGSIAKLFGANKAGVEAWELNREIGRVTKKLEQQRAMEAAKAAVSGTGSVSKEIPITDASKTIDSTIGTNESAEPFLNERRKAIIRGMLYGGVPAAGIGIYAGAKMERKSIEDQLMQNRGY